MADRLVEIPESFVEILFGSPIPKIAPAQIQLKRLPIEGRLLLQAAGLFAGQLERQGRSHSRGDRVLNGKNIARRFVIALRPERTALRHSNQLDAHTNVI